MVSYGMVRILHAETFLVVDMEAINIADFLIILLCQLIVQSSFGCYDSSGFLLRRWKKLLNDCAWGCFFIQSIFDFLIWRF